jgi:hypothetical protein
MTTVTAHDQWNVGVREVVQAGEVQQEMVTHLPMDVGGLAADDVALLQQGHGSASLELLNRRSGSE